MFAKFMFAKFTIVVELLFDLTSCNNSGVTKPDYHY